MQNYKKLIAWEVNDIKKEKEAIVSFRKIAFKYIMAFEEKSNHHSDLLENIKLQLTNKMTFTDNFNKTGDLFEKSKLDIQNLSQIKKNDENKNINTKKNLSIDRTKTMQGKIDEMNDFFEKIQKTLNDSSPDFTSSREFQDFKSSYEKNIELKV